MGITVQWWVGDTSLAAEKFFLNVDKMNAKYSREVNKERANILKLFTLFEWIEQNFGRSSKINKSGFKALFAL